MKKDVDTSSWTEKELEQGFAVRRSRGRLIVINEDGTVSPYVSKKDTKARKNIEQRKSKIKIRNRNLNKRKELEKQKQKENLEKAIQNSKTSTADAGKEDSLSKHMDKNGNLSPEREKIHQDIIREYFEGKTPVSDDEKTYYMTGGGSGTGKSNFVKNEGQKYFDEDFKFNKQTEMFDANVIKIDADDLKGKLYDRQTDGMEFDAGYLHEESSALSKRINQIALDNNYNVMLDSTGDGKPEKLLKKINQAKDKGYKVIGRYGTCGIQKGLQNNLQRYWKKFEKGDRTARYVAEREVISLHRDVTNTLIADAEHFDSVELYDMNDFKNIKKIASASKGSKLKVAKGYEKEYNMFVEKGKLNDEQVLEIAEGYKKVAIRSGRRPKIND